MRFGIAFLLLFSCMAMYAQSDTTYLDQFGQNTIREKASFYRVTTQKDALYLVNDYYLLSRRLQMTGSFSSLNPETKEGAFKYFGTNGKLTSEGSYERNKLHGEWKNYDSIGNLSYVKNYSGGELHGSFTGYYPDGTIRRSEKHDNGKLESGTCFSTTGEEVPFFPYEVPASFEGGRDGLMRYLQNNLKYPKSAMYNDIEGKVFVRFVVDEKGKISNIKVIKSVHPLLDEAAVEVVNKMPNWVPGKIEGKIVKSYFNLPVNFVLE